MMSCLMITELARVVFFVSRGAAAGVLQVRGAPGIMIPSRWKFTKQFHHTQLAVQLIVQAAGCAVCCEAGNFFFMGKLNFINKTSALLANARKIYWALQDKRPGSVAWPLPSNFRKMVPSRDGTMQHTCCKKRRFMKFHVCAVVVSTRDGTMYAHFAKLSFQVKLENQ